MKLFLLFTFIFLMSLKLSFSQPLKKKMLNAVACFQSTNYEASIDSFSAIISMDKNYSEAYYYRGHAYFNLNDYKRAAKDLKKLIKLNYKTYLAYYKLGLIMYNVNKYEKSIEYINKAIQLKSNYAIAFNLRGMCYHRLKKFRMAFVDFTNAIHIDSSLVDAYNNLASTIYYNQDIASAHRNDIILAKKYFDKALRVNPSYFMAYRNRGITYVLLGEYETAIQDFKNAIYLASEDFLSYYYYSVALFNLNKLQNAHEACSMSIKIKPNFVESHILMGILQTNFEKYEDAIQQFETAIELNKEYAGRGNYSIASVYVLMLDTEKTLYYLDLALKDGYFKDYKNYKAFKKDDNFQIMESEKEYISFVKKISKKFR